MESGAKAGGAGGVQQGGGRPVAARDRAAANGDHGITSRTVLATNGAMT
jgi:hypothetical protein